MDRSEIDKAKDTSIQDILGLQKFRRVSIKCPFHDERTPSCVIYPDGHLYCFGCGTRCSDSIDFLVKMGYTFQKAIYYLTNEVWWNQFSPTALLHFWLSRQCTTHFTYPLWGVPSIKTDTCLIICMLSDGILDVFIVLTIWQILNLILYNEYLLDKWGHLVYTVQTHTILVRLRDVKQAFLLFLA